MQEAVKVHRLLFGDRGIDTSSRTWEFLKRVWLDAWASAMNSPLVDDAALDRCYARLSDEYTAIMKELKLESVLVKTMFQRGFLYSRASLVHLNRINQAAHHANKGGLID